MATAAGKKDINLKKDITTQIGNIDLKQDGMEERKLSRPTRQPLKLEPGKNNNLLVEQVVGLQRHGTGVNNKLWVLCKWENKEELNWVEHALLDCDDLIADYIAAKYTQHLAEKENKDVLESEKIQEDLSVFEFGDNYGFARGYDAEYVAGCTEAGPGDTPMLLVKWDTPDHRPLFDIVPREEANKNIPHLVIQFYETRVHWNCMVYSDSD